MRWISLLTLNIRATDKQSWYASWCEQGEINDFWWKGVSVCRSGHSTWTLGTMMCVTGLIQQTIVTYDLDIIGWSHGARGPRCWNQLMTCQMSNAHLKLRRSVKWCTQPHGRFHICEYWWMCEGILMVPIYCWMCAAWWKAYAQIRYMPWYNGWQEGCTVPFLVQWGELWKANREDGCNTYCHETRYILYYIFGCVCESLTRLNTAGNHSHVKVFIVRNNADDGKVAAMVLAVDLTTFKLAVHGHLKINTQSLG
jgi:hypothetical protein